MVEASERSICAACLSSYHLESPGKAISYMHYSDIMDSIAIYWEILATTALLHGNLLYLGIGLFLRYCSSWLMVGFIYRRRRSTRRRATKWNWNQMVFNSISSTAFRVWYPSVVLSPPWLLPSVCPFPSDSTVFLVKQNPKGLGVLFHPKGSCALVIYCPKASTTALDAAWISGETGPAKPIIARIMGGPEMSWSSVIERVRVSLKSC